MLRILLALSLLGLSATPSASAVVLRSYSYFSVRGATFDQLMTELGTRGPQVASTGQRHPGATKLQFNARIQYSETQDACWVSEAAVTVKARIILPRWRDRRKADRELRIYWDALSADIKRHEEGHVVKAKNYSQILEDRLLALPRKHDCKVLAGMAQSLLDKTLADYREESERFDGIESASFDRRLQSLYNYRREQIAAGRLPEP